MAGLTEAVASAALISAGSAGVISVLPVPARAAADAGPDIRAQPTRPPSAPLMTPRRDGACDSANLARRARHSAASSRTMVPERRHPTIPARRLRIAHPLIT